MNIELLKHISKELEPNKKYTYEIKDEDEIILRGEGAPLWWHTIRKHENSAKKRILIYYKHQKGL